MDTGQRVETMNTASFSGPLSSLGAAELVVMTNSALASGQQSSVSAEESVVTNSGLVFGQSPSVDAVEPVVVTNSGPASGQSSSMDVEQPIVMTNSALASGQQSSVSAEESVVTNSGLAFGQSTSVDAVEPVVVTNSGPASGQSSSVDAVEPVVMKNNGSACGLPSPPDVTSTELPISKIVPYSSSSDDDDFAGCDYKIAVHSPSAPLFHLPVSSCLEQYTGADNGSVSDCVEFIPDTDSDLSQEIPIHESICMLLKKKTDFSNCPFQACVALGRNEGDSVANEPCTSSAAKKHIPHTSRSVSDERRLSHTSKKKHMPHTSTSVFDEHTASAERPQIVVPEEEDDEVSSDEHNGGVRVAVANNSTSRIWDKKHYCRYCNKAQSKLARHLILKHKDEMEVQALDCMPLNSHRRRLQLRKLLNEGDYLHNIDVLSSKAGEIIPYKRPSSSSSHEQFIPCEYCRAMFVRTSLWKHQKTCPFKPDSQTDHGGHRCQARGGLLLPFSPEASEELKRDIMSVMHQDEVTDAVRTDDLIMKFGSRLHFKHGHLQHRWQYIRDRIRQMGRLLVRIRKTTSLKFLRDCIVPEHFKCVAKAVRDVCGFDEDEHAYTTPSLALKMGHSLKECVTIAINSCTTHGSSGKEMKKKYKDYLDLCNTEWCHEISSHALRSLHQLKFTKPVVLPLAEDVKLLHNHLTSKAEACKQSLVEEPTSTAWSELCQVTLTQVVTFNRRRGGEAERMLMTSYWADNTENVNVDIGKCLSQVERALCSEFRIIYIQGKRGRRVPVLLTKTLQAQIGLLIELRSTVGVSEANKFIFARRNSLAPHRSSDCLRRFAKECNAKNPGAITTTKLRKHIGTMSQMLALREHELDLLASFLGHDIRIHREFYRLPEQTLQVAKVSKLLIAMEHGETANLQGRNFDDVEVDVPGKTQFAYIEQYYTGTFDW